MARKIKSQKFTLFKFSSWIILLLVLFIYIMYNHYKEGATVNDTTNVIPGELSMGKTGNNESSNSIPTSTQIQARELVKKWQEKLVLDKNANNTLAAATDQYNIDFYKSMS